MNRPDLTEELFESFDELVEIDLCRRRAMVPEKNKLLRCFQYIRIDAVSVGDYCWNGECAKCQVWYQTGEGKAKPALACRLYVDRGMVITDLSPNLRSDLLE